MNLCAMCHIEFLDIPAVICCGMVFCTVLCWKEHDIRHHDYPEIEEGLE